MKNVLPSSQADQKKAKFHQAEGDHLTLLTVYEAWKNSKFSNPWCFDNFVQARSLRRAQDVRKQLITIMDRYKLLVVSAGKNYNKIRKAVCSGFFPHAAKVPLPPCPQGARLCGPQDAPILAHFSHHFKGLWRNFSHTLFWTSSSKFVACAGGGGV